MNFGINSSFGITQKESEGYLFTETGDESFVISAGLTPEDVSEIDTSNLNYLIDWLKNTKSNSFLLVIYEHKSQRIYAVNDHYGSNEILFCSTNNQFILTDNIKYLKTNHESLQFDYARVNEYFAFGFIQPPNTIFADVKAVPSAQVLEVKLDTKTYCLTEFWNPGAALQKKVNNAEKLVAKLRNGLENSVNRERKYKHSYGVSLSGGVDSGGLFSALTSITGIKSTAFTVGPYGEKSGDLPSARKTAQYNKAKQIELYPDERNIFDLKEYVKLLNQPLDGHPLLVNAKVLTTAKDKGVERMLFGFGTDNVLGCQKYSKLAHLLDKLSFIPKNFLRVLLWSYVKIKEPSVDQKLILLSKDHHERFLRIKSIHYWSYSHLLEDSSDPYQTIEQSGLKEIFSLSHLSLVDRYVYADWKYIHVYQRHGLVSKIARPLGITVYNPAYTPVFGNELMKTPDKIRKIDCWDKYVFRETVRPFSPEHLYNNQRKSCILNVKQSLADLQTRAKYRSILINSKFAKEIIDVEKFFDEFDKLPTAELVLMKLLTITFWYEHNFEN